MKGFAVFTKSLIFVLILAASAFAQTEQTQPNKSNKIAVVNSYLFYDEKSGMPELAEVNKAFEAEVASKFDIEIKSKQEEHKALILKIFRLGTEIRNLQKENSDTSDKSKELETLRTKFDRIELELNSLIENRKQYVENQEPESLKVLKIKIGKSIEQFKNQKGFAMILDVSNDSCYFVVQYENDVTQEFIKFYNENSDKEKTQ